MSTAGGSAELANMPLSSERLPAMSLTSDVAVLCWNTPTESDRRAQKIAAFLGANVQFVSLTAETVQGRASARATAPRCSCIIVNAETLAKIADELPIADLSAALESAEHSFVYGFQPTKRHDAVLQALSSGQLGGISPLSGRDLRIRVTATHPEWCFQFSGLSVGTANPARENVFAEKTEQGSNAALVRIGDEPFFIRVENATSQLFFVAGGELADLDERVPRDGGGLQWFCSLVPLMMFLRGTLGDRVWRNDHPRACFIIDDPLLKERHGFLKYKRLVESMRRHRFAACIAFIPWNYRRSSRDIAELFSANRDVVSLCIHGCDHTSAEFENTDERLLRRKAKLALERMRVHQQLSGVPFDDVMVFPQGLFSTEAMPALKESGYLAAVNTEMSPSTMPEALSLRDLLDVAVTRFGDFPLFGRRYPNNLAEFAFDLFMGKPALVVEHHGYFRDGYRALEEFVAGLNALDERIEWTNLGNICSRACLCRTRSNGDVQARFYTNRFQLENDTERKQNYELFYSLSSGEPLPSVSVDGRAWGSEREENNLKLRLSLNPGRKANIQILGVGKDTTDLAPVKTIAYEATVRARRLLCEFRDNYVHTNPVLRRILTGGK